MATSIFRTPIALVSLVDQNRQWFKAKVGLEVCETGREESFCGHAILKDEIMVVEDAQLDERFHDNPFVIDPPHIRFYAGAPLIDPDGHVLGSLCIIDIKPGKLNPQERNTLAMLGRQVVDQIELRNAARRASRLQRELVDAADQPRNENQPPHPSAPRKPGRRRAVPRPRGGIS